jgi:predicted dehydrogenase
MKSLERLTRRQVLKSSSTRLLAGCAAASALSASKILGANDRLRLGAIGTGGRTRYLMGLLKNLPGNEQVAVCDVYEPNMDQAAAIAGTHSKRFSDYRAMLDSQEVDAVVIGSPDHWHKQMTIDAVNAGKDVYVEKPISHSIDEGEAMVAAVEASGHVVQTGTQQRSWEHFILGEQIVKSGKLGQITFGQACRTWMPRSWTGSAGWVPPRTSRSDPSAFFCGAGIGTLAAVR